jgi:hypothetical protein
MPLNEKIYCVHGTVKNLMAGENACPSSRKLFHDNVGQTLPSVNE